MCSKYLSATVAGASRGSRVCGWMNGMLAMHAQRDDDDDNGWCQLVRLMMVRPTTRTGMEGYMRGMTW